MNITISVLLIKILYIGVPKILRSDYGTENSWIAALHIAFHLQNQSDIGERCYIYGQSKRNVRVTYYWF